jgi:NAD(P)-dependent dehydrogenase (short-subunit alcohol dehydrogenase family)
MFANGLLKGRRILVTGGGSGLGKAMSSKFLQLGAEVHICGRRKMVCDDTAAELMKAHGGKVVSHGLDIRDAAAVDHMVGEIFETSGPLTDLINNAAGNFIARAEDLSPNGWNAVIGIVLNGSFYCSRAVGRHLIARKAGGSIVSILANYVWTGSAGTIHSAAAKAGVMSMTQTLATEWATHGIRVNAVAPGPIESPGAAKQLWNSPEAVKRITDMVPLKRWGKPEEIANAVAFLVSPYAGYITGDILTIDGGAWLGRGTFGFTPEQH